ncbi:TlpA disulfide reductase family protein [Rhodoblastus sp.]|uniref:TlpA family protein disulfide reductase n=1 Tax=Rhodoblastus sp. TaxID=1962975 RepID=UPI002631EAD3|nr:TlpA disulfide reductase family protein [Rhodoblastus sp.]
MKRAVLAGLSILALGAALWLPSRWALALDRGAPPHLEFRDAAGRPTTIDAFSGKVVLLDFWASWCLPCRDEIPALDRLQALWGSRGLVVVPVSIDANGLEAAAAFYAERRIIHLAKFTDPSREAAKKLGFVGIPSALVLDRHGRIVARIEGPINWESSRITTLFERLFGEE